MHLKKPTIYLAGKISKNDWRHEVVPGLRGHVDGGPNNMIPTRDFNYAGPYFASCDHGCYHTAQSHGAMSKRQKSRASAKKAVFDRCELAVKLSDLIIIYISDKDCHGTLIEVGWVQILNKDHVLIFAPGMASKKINDFWFSTMKNPIDVIYGVEKHDVAKVIKTVIKDYTLNRDCGN